MIPSPTPMITPVAQSINYAVDTFAGLDFMSISKLGVQGVLSLCTYILWKKTERLERKNENINQSMLVMEREHGSKLLEVSEGFKKVIDETIKPQIESNRQLTRIVQQLYEHNMNLKKSK